jgi:hypothetical protein
MATYSKTQGVVLLAHQAATHPVTIVGTAADVTTKISATIFCFHAIVEDTPMTNPGVFLIQASASASGNEDWVTLVKFRTKVVAGSVPTEALTATESDDTLAVASTTGFAAEDIVYIIDSTTLAASEWNQVESIVTDTTIDLFDTLTTTKDSLDFIWGDAEVFITQIDLSAIGRIRVVFAHDGATAANSHVKALMVQADSIA